ncbi:MAG: glycoside hydrolase family 3 C-terminal domain-containing protein [Bacteroidetes bacterium]|nr:glycoside hydrolase family 3 C-terminal domain-containing protein [Bacteroidota bacterium]
MYKKTFLLFTVTIVVLISTFAQPKKTQVKQPVLGYRSTKILEEKGLQFKDLNKNGLLDKYEDWRLSNNERALDLLSKMSMEDKVGFMLISTARLKSDQSNNPTSAMINNATVSSDFNEEDQVQKFNMFTKQPLPVAMMMSAGTTKGVTKFHLRHFIFRANVSAKLTAEWSNKLQALCESDGLGIPAIIASNPRNHITKDASIGLSVGKTVFSTWPGELGLSAMRDLKLVREFADIARQEWQAVGLRKGYMYMADLSTEPRWQRIEGTFGEDANWTAKMITEIVLGFQGTKLSNQSIAMTTKHFPGGGAGVGGQDPHFSWGKFEHFPGKMFQNNLIPFKAAIKAGTSAIMPYYSIPQETKYEQIAYAYNKAVIKDLLRDSLKFTGIINSDTGPIEMMPWGAENLTIVERYQKTLEAGVNLYSGTADPTKLLETVQSGKVDIKLVDNSVYRLLIEKFQLGLFENPYVDEAAAEKIVGNANFQAKADLAMRKSIVLLRNESKTLPIKPRTKVYLESYFQKTGGKASNIYSNEKNTSNVEFVKTPEEAELIVVWINPGAKSLFQSDGSPLLLSLSKNAVDINYINQLSAKKTTVLAINYTNPWVIDEIYNDADKKNIKGVIATFGTTLDALVDVLTGKFNPSGKMPFTTPISEAVVEKQLSDVPGFLKGSNYGLFKFNEGIRYQ